MRILILSDMHSNIDAFDAVLERSSRRVFDMTLVLGDVVGYGGGPNETVDRLRELSAAGPLLAVRGNHDKVVSGIDAGGEFNQIALAAAHWTADTLTDENLRYVRDLQPGPLPVSGDVAICHGTPLDEDAYLFSSVEAEPIFARHRIRLTFFGHTHVPSVFSTNGREIRVSRLVGARGLLRLEPGWRYLVNPGSIGQPRDRDPRAAFMTFDSERGVVSWHRVRYPVERARDRIVEAGLPRTLGDRLLLGI